MKLKDICYVYVRICTYLFLPTPIDGEHHHCFICDEFYTVAYEYLSQ